MNGLRRIGKRLRQLAAHEDGPTSTEYAVMFALIIVVAVASIKALGTKVSTNFASASQGW